MARPQKYPLRNLAVGSSILIPWEMEENGDVAKGRRQDRIYAAIRQEERRFSKKFERRKLIAGLRVRRVT